MSLDLEKYLPAIEALKNFKPDKAHWERVAKFFSEKNIEADKEEKKLEMSWEEMNRPFDL